MAEMIVDRVDDRISQTGGSQSNMPAVIEGVETRVEGMGSFGPIRTVHRRYHAETAEALGSARRLRESREECQHVMHQFKTGL